MGFIIQTVYGLKENFFEISRKNFPVPGKLDNPYTGHNVTTLDILTEGPYFAQALCKKQPTSYP